MNLDNQSAFGRYRLNPFFQALLSFAQNTSQNWLGERLAKLIRKLILAWSKLPIDLTVGPIKMRCYLRDNYSEKKFAFMPWRFDGPERQLLLDIIPCDGTFLDIGANVGIYTLTVATHLNSSGRVVALEPNPPAFQRLCFNLSATQAGRAGWPKVDALQIGVSNRSCELELHTDPGNLGASSVAPNAHVVAGDSETGVVRIACKPLISILEELRIEQVDVIKIDIEGAEDTALFPYFDEAPEASLPRCLIIENNEHLWKLDLPGLLGRKGYRVHMHTRLNTVYLRDQPSPAADGPASAVSASSS